jgi:hypothetical protein
VPFIRAIEQMFRQWSENSMADIPRPDLATLAFIGSVLFSAQSRALFGDFAGACAEHRDEAADEATDLFVRGYALSGEA